MFVPLRSNSHGSADSSGATTASSVQPPTPDDAVAPLLPLKGDAAAFLQIPTAIHEAHGQGQAQETIRSEEESSDDEQDVTLTDAQGPTEAKAGESSSAAPAAEDGARGLTRRGRPRKLFRYLQDVGGTLLVPSATASSSSAQPAATAAAPSQSSKRKLSNASSSSKLSKPSGLVKAEDTTDDLDGGLDEDAKKKKKFKVARACIFCKRSHMTCDDERPCKRCHKRGIAHMCGDEEPAAAAAPAAASTSRKGKEVASAKGKDKDVAASAAAKGKEGAASSSKGKDAAASRARKPSISRNKKRSASPSAAAFEPRPPMESSLSDAFSALTSSVNDNPPLHVREAAPSIPERRSSTKPPFATSDDGLLGASGLTPTMSHHNASSSSALPEHPLSLPLAGAFSDPLGSDSHDPAPLLSLTQLTPGGQIQIPTGELFWASFPSGGGVTPGMIGGGLTPFETFLKENQGASSEGYAAAGPAGSAQHLPHHMQHSQPPLLTPLGMFRLADGSLQGLEVQPAPLTHANVSSTTYHHAHPTSDNTLSHYNTSMPASASSYDIALSNTSNGSSHAAVAPLPRWDCPEYQRLKSWLEGPSPSAAWTPALRGRLLHSIDVLKNVIQPRTAGLDGMEKHRQDVDFARVHTHYKHAVLESISAPILLVRRWGDVCDANSHLLNLLGLDPSHFNPPRAGLTDIFSAKLAAHLYERYAQAMQEPHHNSLAIRATGHVQTAFPPASGLRDSPSIRCAISFQIVTDAQGLPLMGVATLLPVDSGPDV